MNGTTIASCPLNDARHEKFAQLLTEGRSQLEAYVDAGYKPQKSNAARLASRPDVAARVTWLKSVVAERTANTTEGIVRQLDEDRQLARNRGNASAAVAATMAKAKVLGLIRKQNQMDLKPISQMTIPELRILLGISM